MNNTNMIHGITCNNKNDLPESPISNNISYPILVNNIQSISNKNILNASIKYDIYCNSKRNADFYRPKQKKIQSDYLYHCRELFRRYPESISTAQIGKLIQIEWLDTQYHLTSKKITLPGGHDIYVAQFSGRTVISDGEIYHIEDAIGPPKPSLVACMMNLLSHLAGIASHHFLYSLTGSSTTSTPGPPYSGHQPANRKAGLPFLLPGAAGAIESRENHDDDLTSMHSEFATANIQQPDRQDMKVCETILHLPNYGARKLYAELREEYIEISSAKIYSLEWLSGMNSFVDNKLTEIFDRALYLKHRIHCADMIMIKKYIERKLHDCFELRDQLAIDEKRIKRILFEEKGVEDYFDSFNDDIRKALHSINFHTLRKVIEYKNGVAYINAKQNFMQNFTASGQPMDASSAEFYSLLELMEKAQENYEKNLRIDDYQLIDRMLYFNDRELFLTMLDEQSNGITQILIKRFFYYIFEYSRNNGFSTQGNVYIIPGEFTEFWHNFQPTEPVMNEAELATVLTEQIVDFMNNTDKPRLHLERVFKCIDFVRAHYADDIRLAHWKEANIWSYNKSLAILDKIININLKEINEQKETSYGQWSESIISRIIYNKESTFMLHFLIKLQHKLIAIVSHFFEAKLILSASTNEQRLLEAKLLAMKMTLPMHQSHLARNEIMEKYTEQLSLGNIDLLLRAATYWYLEYHNKNSYRLNDLDALSIIRNFNEAESLTVFDFQSRADNDIQTIFGLRHSDNFTNLKEYFDQFIYYNTYTLPQEARHMSYKMIERSSLDYLELIYPPKKILTFKIFSRNYVQNSLTPVSDLSVPQNNFGTFSLVKTCHDKWMLVSTLFSAPAIKELTFSENDTLFKYILKESEGTAFQLNWQNRKQIPVTSDELLGIFNMSYDSSNIGLSPLSFFLVKPENNIASMPTPEYTLVAGSGEKPFTSLLEMIDYWNVKTLTETVQEFKESLRIVKWWDRLLSLIPFYDTLWKYWYDSDHRLKIIDVIFDAYDAIFLFGQLTINTGRKITSASIGVADLASLPKKYLNKQVSQALINALPTIARRGSISLAHRIFGLVNPIPFSGLFSKSFQKSLLPSISADISWMSNVVINVLDKKKTKLVYWKYSIEGKNLTFEFDGTYTIDKGLESERRLIKLANDFYQIIWDDKISNWRLVNQYELVNLNYAVPVNKDNAGNWSALNFLDIDQIPLLNNNRFLKKADPEFDTIRFEPLRILNTTQNIPRKTPWAYSYFLELMLENYTVYLAKLFSQGSELSTMLAEFAGCLTDDKQFRKVFAQEPENTVDEVLLDFITNLNKNHNVQVSYRISRMWKTEHDHNPEDHLVILIEIDNERYIIDMLQLRPDQMFSSDGIQVFTEPDWVHFLKTRVANDFSLIKYKDFTLLAKAVAFPYREADYAGKYIKDAFLVREPLWYKTASIKYVHHSLGHESFFDNHRPTTVLAAARNVIAQYRPGHQIYSSDIINMTLPFNVLQEARIIDSTQAGEMIKLLPASVYTGPASLNFMSAQVNIVKSESLLKLKPGSLLALLTHKGYLFHLMVCVGNGRFAGLGNDFFLPSFNPGPSIVVAEEMGIFLDNKLVTRNTTTHFTVIAGNPITVPTIEPVMLETMAIERTAQVSSSGEDVIESISFPQRVKMLTKDAWSLGKSLDDNCVLILKIEAMPTNIYPLHAKEMAHMIRALIFANPDFPAFSSLTRIDIISCFPGFDGVALRAQTLADELDLPIYTYPYMDTATIRERQPQWYSHFLPRHNVENLTAVSDDGIINERIKLHHFSRINAKNERLAKIIDMLRDIRRSLNHTRIKRRMAFLPTIIIDLARLVIRDINFYNFTIIYPLSNKSETTLQTILREYTPMMSEADEYYIQCFLDIIHNVDDFAHLEKYIFPILTRTTEHSALSTPLP